jgi:hypothetical protein
MKASLFAALLLSLAPFAFAPDGRIYLDVVVTPNGGAPVAGLEQKDFTVLDNKVAQPIASFEALGGEKACAHRNMQDVSARKDATRHSLHVLLVALFGTVLS